MKKLLKKINLITKPGTAINNQTGPWRTQRPTTDLASCIGCSWCEKICPEGCIKMKNDSKFDNKPKPQVDYNYCKGCALCAHECPVKAIKMEDDF